MNELPFAPAAERNRDAIREMLGRYLPAKGALLEIGSGTGQHAVFLAAAFPTIQWWPSDRAVALEGLSLRVKMEGTGNVHPPLLLDVLENPFPDGPFQAVFSANTAHIMSWAGVQAMLAGVGIALDHGGVFCLYGPFRIDGRFTTASNHNFHENLQAQDSSMGLRDRGELESLARDHQMTLEACETMPANNFMLIFRKGD